MTVRSFSSFDDMRGGLGMAAMPGADASEVLRVSAEVYTDDAAAAARTCRKMALDWIRSRSRDALPPEAARFETFALESGSRSVEGARLRTESEDVWAARLVHASGPDSGEVWVTEVQVRESAGRLPEVRLQLLREGGPRRGDGPRVPDLLIRLASVVELRRHGQPLITDAWRVDSEAGAGRLYQELTSGERRLPWMVLSVPDNAPDRNRPLLDPEEMARATAGLAIVVVLPSNFTWTLSRKLDSQLSVYRGAVRLYLPGFDERANPRDHRRILADYLLEPGGLERHRNELLRRVAEQSLIGSEAWSFAEVRDEAPLPEPAPDARPPAARTPRPAVPQPAPAPEPLPEPEPEPEPEPAPEPEPEPAPAPVAPDPPAPPVAAAPPEALPRATGAAPPPETEPEEVGPAPAEEPPPESQPWWRGLRARGGAVWRALRGLPDPAVAATVASLQRDVDAAERRAKEAERRGDEQRKKAETRIKRIQGEKEEYEREWEVAETRTDEAVRERDLAVAEVQRLREQVEDLGGTPSVPRALPRDWSTFAAWCEAELTGRVRLLPRARREVKRARFADVELAARCLLWLAGDYRKLRLETSGQGLKATVENGVHNQLCGGDAFNVKWRGRNVRVNWHIKSGGTTHDPTRCLRIYYFWDSSSDEAVIAWMPSHVRTHAS